MGIHVKGSVPLICIVRKRSCFVFEAFEISVFPQSQQSFSNEVYRNYRAPMMDSLSTELIAQLYRNPSEINRWQTVVMNAILFWYWIWNSKKKKIKKEKKETKKLIFWRRFWYDLSIMTLQRRLIAVVYRNNFPVVINCHYVSTIPFFFLSNFVFLVLQHFFFRRLILDLVDGS